MTVLTSSEAFDDSPHFQLEVEKAQEQIHETWGQMNTWVEKFRIINQAVKEFQQSTHSVAAVFHKLCDENFIDTLQKGKLERMRKSIDAQFSYFTAHLKKMEKDLLDPITSSFEKIVNETKAKKEAFEIEQKSYNTHILNYTGLIKCTMDPESASDLVNESHRLYSLRVSKCQKYLDWIDYLNRVQANGETWWLQEICFFFERLACCKFDGLQSPKIYEDQIDGALPSKKDGLRRPVIDFVPSQTNSAENVFRTEFARYRKTLGLPVLNTIDVSMLKCALDLLPNQHERAGYLLFSFPTKKTSIAETWSRGFFQVSRDGQLCHIPSSICQTQLPPIELSSTTISEMSHPQRHNVLQLSIIGIDKVQTINLQADSTAEKKAWLAVFQTYISDTSCSINDYPRSSSQIESNQTHNVSVDDSIYEKNSTESQASLVQLCDMENKSTTGSHIVQFYNRPIVPTNNDNDPNFGPSPRKVFNPEIVNSRLLDGEEMTIKVGQVFIRELKPKPRDYFNTHHPSNYGTWKKIMFTLKSTGVLCQFPEQDSSIFNTIDLKRISRFNIQPLDDSFFNHQASFVIDQGGKDVHYFCVATRTERNIWLCLLKGFALPEILGQVIPIPKVYRMFRSFWIRIMDGRSFSTSSELYCQIAFDGDSVAFTSAKAKTTSPLWREDFSFDDLPSFQKGVTVNVFSHNRYQKDSSVGQAFIPVRSMRPGEIYEGWYPVIPEESKSSGLFQSLESKKKKPIQSSIPSTSPNNPDPSSLSYALNEQNLSGLGAVADLRLKICYDEIVVLRTSEYEELLQLILDFESDIVYDLAISPKYLDWVSETLLKIFSARHQTIPWLNYLAEKEVTHTEDPNILFRGNSILTKAIDAYMKMIGLEYVDGTIGDIIRDICYRKVACEVDDSKLSRPEDVKGQWKVLLSFTNQLFSAIQKSRNQCPRELRCFFGHLRKLISEKYSNLPEQLDMTKYTCVSGFLFLRLFCPAVLSPRLFGLVKEHPDPKTHRTLTLLAKSLQCLANLADFGSKEPYMAHMNNFILENTQHLMEFIDYIASPPSPEVSCLQTKYPLPPHPTGFIAQLPPHKIDLDRELSFLSGYISRNTKFFKQVAANPAVRSSQPGKLEKLSSIVNAIDFTVKDYVKSGTQDVTTELLL